MRDKAEDRKKAEFLYIIKESSLHTTLVVSNILC